MAERPTYEELEQRVRLLEQSEGGKTMQTLEESEARFKLMFDQAPLPYQSLDENGTIVEVNQSWLDVLGFSKKEVIGRNFGDFLHPDWVDHFHENFPKFKKAGEILGVEFEMVKKDGSTILVTFNGKISRGPDHEFRQTHCIFHNITERKNYEHKLEWNLKRNALLSETAASLLQSDDPQALVEDLCRRVMEFIDCQVFFNYLEDSREGKLRLNACAGIPGSEARKMEWLDHGTAVCGSVAQSRQPMVCEDILNCDNSLTTLVKSYGIQAYCCHPLMVQDRLIGTLSFGRRSRPFFEVEEIDLMASVTNLVAIAMNRIEMENKLRDSESRLRMFAETAPLGIVIADEQEKIVYINSRFTELFGYVMKDMPSVKEWWDLAYPENSLRNSMKREWKIAVEKEKRNHSEIFLRESPIVCKDGTVRQVEIRMATNGNLNVVLFADITERKRAEAQRQEGFDLLNHLARLVPGVIYQYRIYPDGRSAFPYSSPGIYDIYEVTPEEVREDASIVFGRLHPEDHDWIAEAIMESARTLKTFSCEMRVVLPQKGLGWRWSQAHPERTEDGGTLWHGIILDITERKRAEEALRHSHELMQYIIDHANSAVAVHDRDLRYVYVSRRYLKQFGIEGQNIIGRHHYDVFPDLPEKWREAHRKALAGEVGSSERDAYEHEDGTVDWTRWECRPWYEKDGSIGGIIVYTEVITERVETERRLRESEAHQRAIFDSAQDAIYLKDTNLRYTHCNTAMTRLFHCDREAIMGRTDAELFDEGNAEEITAMDRRILAGQPIRGAFTRKIQGEKRIIDTSKAPVFDASGNVVGLCGVSRDITEEVNLRDQMRQAQKVEAIGRLAGGVAHDLNNLLTPILGYGEMLMDDLGAKDMRREKVNEILRAGGRARDLVRQLLAFSRKQVLDFKVLDVNKAIRDFEKLLKRTIPEDVEIKVILSPDVHPIMADFGQIEQILMNLAVNAADAMPDGGYLTIETAPVELDETYTSSHSDLKPGRYLLLAVSDTGCGMDAETLEKIYEPFFSTKGERGTGLGLATVYGIVKQHNGNIWVYSEPGKGTTFKIYLPVADQDLSTEKPPEKTLSDLRGSETILVVEDNRQVRQMALNILKRQGYELFEAENGDEALTLLTAYRGQVHLLITDVVMPGLNGREIYEKASSIHPELKVLYMSGYMDDVIAHRGILEPGVWFIQKPFSVKGLATKVREVLEQGSESGVGAD